MNRISVILAGGGGTRFWPLSRQNRPKQLINISGNDIMLNDTISRYESVISAENTIIVTNKTQVELLGKILLEKVPRENILKEPIAKNTAACILYAAMTIKKKYGDAVMAVLPSDHYFNDIDGFRSILNEACTIAEQSNKLVTIGITPSFPSSGYGYINYGTAVSNEISENVYKVNEFIEKPNYEKAVSLVKSGDYLWNSGMFMWKVSVILDCFSRYLPRLFNKFTSIYDYLGTPLEEEHITNIYPLLQSISIDYGILERSDDVLVLKGDFGWNDVGSWDALGAIFPPDINGNIIKANYQGIQTKNSIIYGNSRLIATIGIDNLIIADTQDAILICPKNRAQDVKELVDLLKENGLKEFI